HERISARPARTLRGRELAAKLTEYRELKERHATVGFDQCLGSAGQLFKLPHGKLLHRRLDEVQQRDVSGLVQLSGGLQQSKGFNKGWRINCGTQALDLTSAY